MWVRRQMYRTHADNFLGVLDEFEVVCRLIRREPIPHVRYRSNPFIEFNEDYFLDMFHLSRFRMVSLFCTCCRGWAMGLIWRNARLQLCWAPLLQMLVALRFYATSSFLHVDDDLFGTYISTVSRIAALVSRKTAALWPDFIQFPDRNKVLALQDKFYTLGCIPGFVGAIGCTHIAVRSPGGDHAQPFRNRNVQVIGD